MARQAVHRGRVTDISLGSVGTSDLVVRLSNGGSVKVPSGLTAEDAAEALLLHMRGAKFAAASHH